MKYLTCPRCGNLAKETPIGKRCRDCAEAYDMNGNKIYAKRNSDGDLLASLCEICCPTQHGTRRWKLDIAERLLVVQSNLARVSGSLVSVANPDITMSVVKRLEAQAHRWLARAERIEARLERNTRNRLKLYLKLKRLEFEIALLQDRMLRKKHISKRELKRVVNAYMKRTYGNFKG